MIHAASGSAPVGRTCCSWHRFTRRLRLWATGTHTMPRRAALQPALGSTTWGGDFARKPAWMPAQPCQANCGRRCHGRVCGERQERKKGWWHAWLAVGRLVKGQPAALTHSTWDQTSECIIIIIIIKVMLIIISDPNLPRSRIALTPPSDADASPLPSHPTKPKPPSAVNVWQ
jgi:hypothetical protein